RERTLKKRSRSGRASSIAACGSSPATGGRTLQRSGTRPTVWPRPPALTCPSVDNCNERPNQGVLMQNFLKATLRSTEAATLLSGFAAAQGRQTAPINIQPAMSMDVVLFAAANAGKVLATTDASGKGMMDVSDLINLGKLDVVEEMCPDKTRLLLVMPGTQ